MVFNWVVETSRHPTIHTFAYRRETTIREKLM